jgi:hypothetical protein
LASWFSGFCDPFEGLKRPGYGIEIADGVSFLKDSPVSRRLKIHMQKHRDFGAVVHPHAEIYEFPVIHVVFPGIRIGENIEGLLPIEWVKLLKE